MNNYELIKKASTMVSMNYLSTDISRPAEKQKKEPSKEELIAFIKRKIAENKKDGSKLFNNEEGCCSDPETEKDLKPYPVNVLSAIARNLIPTYYSLEVR